MRRPLRSGRGASRLSRLMAPGETPEHWDFTLLPFAPFIERLLDAVAAKTVVEVGADRGDFTEELLEWAARTSAEVTAVDPAPAPQLVELAGGHPELNLVREPSHQALTELPLAQAIVLDGDHNYFTLSGELRLIAERSGDAGLPLLLIHDLGWPHARRDTYYAPERIPEADRQPVVQGGMVAPGDPGMARIGIRFPWVAEREGGPSNGLLTAVENFLEGRRGLRLEIIPVFFGLGVVWPENASWAGAVEAIVSPWASNRMLERLEEVRLDAIIDQARIRRQEDALRRLLGSRAFSLAERLSRARRREDAAVSRERIRRALGDAP
jgi:hypothetical protein